MNQSPTSPSASPNSEPNTSLDEMLHPNACFHRRRALIEALEFESNLVNKKKEEVEAQLTKLNAETVKLEEELEDIEFHIGEFDNAIVSVSNTISIEQQWLLANNAG